MLSCLLFFYASVFAGALAWLRRRKITLNKWTVLGAFLWPAVLTAIVYVLILDFIRGYK